jgi:hypothetical protein
MLREGHEHGGKGKRKKERRHVWLMYCPYKTNTEYLKNNHKKGTKVERRKME